MSIAKRNSISQRRNLAKLALLNWLARQIAFFVTRFTIAAEFGAIR